jgi:hypothetical protein
MNKIKYILKPWENNKPHALTHTAWVEFYNQNKKKYPIRWFLFETLYYDIKFKLNWKIWEILHKYIPKYKHHIIKTSLSPGYYDPDIQILYAVMDTVKEFVENTENKIIWDNSEEHKKVKSILDDVYNWWTVIYPNRKEPEYPDINIFNILDESDPKLVEFNNTVSKINEIEKWWKEEEMAFLIKAIKIRDYLWYP